MRDLLRPAPPISWRSAAGRAIGLFVVWFVLSRGVAAEFLPGIVATAAATWLSLRLLPPGESCIAPVALGTWWARFLGQSLVAGADVARRALDPALPLDPGFISYAPDMAPGPARHLFATLVSLQPGTLPAGPDRTGALRVHCLDRRQPVAAQLAAEEVLLLRALGRRAGDG